MRHLESGLSDVRAEIVTSTFVASGRPEGVRDLGRFLENLNNPAIAQQIELRSPSVRPLYRATSQLALDAPLLVRRDQMIFANFEGPHFSRDAAARAANIDVPALLLVPPFQISGLVMVAQEAEISQSLRSIARTFFLMRNARVFDADGALLGEGEQIVVNGDAVQMLSATRQHIAAIGAVPVTRADEAADTAAHAEQEQTRAA